MEKFLVDNWLVMTDLGRRSRRIVMPDFLSVFSEFMIYLWSNF